MRESGREAGTTPSRSVAGLDSATLAERFIAAFRLPYGLSCILIGFGLFGVFDRVLASYAEFTDLSRALRDAVSWQNLAQSALIAYAFYAPRLMRGRLAETDSAVPSLMGDESRGLRNPFSGISARRPQIVAWVAFLAALLIAVNVRLLMGAPSRITVNLSGPFSPFEFFAAAFNVLSLAVATLALSSVMWTYYSITRGIQRFSQAPLELRPYYEDRFLGLKPIGSLALTLASVYFGFIALLLLSVLTSPATPDVGDLLGVGGFLFGLIVLGVFLFFLPLTHIHRRMVEEKRKARTALIPELRAIFEASNPSSHDDLSHVFRVDMLDRKVANMAVWPYDLGILGRLGAIVASVTAILISRVLALILKF